MKAYQRTSTTAVLILLAVMVPAGLCGQRPEGPATPGAPDALAIVEGQVQRLANLSKLWGTVRYLHPYLGYKEIDWDDALVKAVPKVVNAKSAEEYAAAVRGMLDALGDPATRLVRQTPPKGTALRQKGKAAAGKLFTWAGDGILAIHLTDPDIDLTLWTRRADLTALAKEMEKARGLIFDLRDGAWPMFTFRYAKLDDLLPSRELVLPAHRYLVHSGYRPQGRGSSVYRSAFQTDFLETIPPTKGKHRPTVFVVNDRSELPPLALALQQAGDARVVSQGEMSAGVGARVKIVPLGEGFVARVRLSELVDRSGAASAAWADAEVPAGGDLGPDGPAFKAALALLADRQRGRQPAKAGAPLPPAVWRADRPYPEMAYPDLGHRVLALSRLWNVIHYFYPYHDLIGNWDGVLPEFVSKFVTARDARQYALAVAEMSTHVADNHTRVTGSPELQKFFGEFLPQVELRLIEGAPVITQVWGEAAREEAGPRVGDVVVRVDGEPVERRMARYGKYLAASTPATHKRNILRVLLGGPKTSPVKLTVRRADGALKEVAAPRRETTWQAIPKRDGAVFRILSGNVGYVDLDRLTLPEIDPLFEKLKGTSGIIFDMRGYPHGTAWAIAPRLNTRKARFGAAFQRRLVSDSGGLEDRYQGTASFAFRQPLPTSDKGLYRGKTVMLIDERTQSQAEHTGLFFEAACGITFIGSHSSGADGDITSLVLPGGLTMTFTGHDVRHADGRQLQRIGLVPHVEVAPTLQGVREGRDEVLERATRFLREGK